MFDWGDYLRLAHQLAQDSGEAEQRSAISRSYYAAYCMARNWLIPRDRHIRAGSKSIHIWHRFERDSDRTWRRIGVEGKRLKSRREEADYSNKVTSLPNKVTDALNKADYIINTLDRLS